MTDIYSYLTFNGNCRQAMTFYKECLDAELSLQTVGESPRSEALPRELKEFILHAMLTKGTLVLMASDMSPEQGLVKGNSVSLLLNCSREEEVRVYYKRLSSGGSATHPLELTFRGALFGSLMDKFGNHWFLNCNATKPIKQLITTKI